MKNHISQKFGTQLPDAVRAVVDDLIRQDAKSPTWAAYSRAKQVITECVCSHCRGFDANVYDIAIDRYVEGVGL